MTNEELYDLMKRGFDDLKAEMKDIRSSLISIDARLRTVETDVAELKGRRLAIKEWIPIACSVVAVIVSIFALLKT